MKISELQQKNDADLMNYVGEKQEELRKLRFGLTGSGMRNSHAIRNLRREIARALTLLTARSKKGDIK